ncbi:MAG: hypothetical protein L3K11_00810 [Thermoplasmata archaeon]|nr:hypothetical protein [Thermoplasmata archaeon]
MTLRQRWRRSRRAQVSAVAVVLGLLLVTTYIANFLSQQLPSQMQELEFEHTLLVEDQLGRVQTAVLAEAQNPTLPITITSPVTLGSGSVPPFAPASTGALTLDPASDLVRAQYSIAKVLPRAPVWGSGSACLAGGSGTCVLGAGVFFYNASANSSTYTVILSGATSTLFYNLSGNHDTLTVTQSGPDALYLQIIVVGSNDTVTVSETGALVGSSHYDVEFYGQNDRLNSLIAGAHTGAGSTSFLTRFVGDQGSFCPAANWSATDSLNLVDTSNAFNANTTWWNNVGYTSPPVTHALLAPGSSATFSNRTGFLGCGFSHASVMSYTSDFQSGLRVHLANRYNPPEDVVYEDGAVILSHPASGTFMTGPPTISITRSLTGFYIANFTIVNMVVSNAQNGTSEEGVSTAGVSTHLIGFDQFQVLDNVSNGNAVAGLWLNFTTPYPGAWEGYLEQFPATVLVNDAVTCTTGPLPPGFTCLIPPQGQISHLSAEFLVTEFEFTAITISTTIS